MCFLVFRVTAMAVFGDSGKQNTYSGIALVHESGKIEMQYFTRDLTVTVPAEEEKLETVDVEDEDKLLNQKNHDTERDEGTFVLYPLTLLLSLLLNSPSPFLFPCQ